MPYVAKVTFQSQYGSFTEKKKMKFTSGRPSKDILKQWIQNGLCTYIPDKDSNDGPNEEGEYEVPPPEELENLLSQDQEDHSKLVAAVESGKDEIGTPRRSADLGSLAGDPPKIPQIPKQ